MRTYETFLAFVLCGTINSCAPRSYNTATVTHFADRVAVGRHPTHWIDVTLDQYATTQGKPVLNSAIQKRLQAWTDIMDATLRSSEWGKRYMIATPKPKIAIIKSDESNAYVYAQPVRYPGEVSQPGATSEPSESVEQCALWDEYGVHQGTPFNMPSIPGGNNLLSDVVERQHYYGSKNGFKCLPEWRGSGRVVFEGCPKPKIGTVFNSYCSLQTSNVVTLLSNLVVTSSEESVVSVIAHELGHYYQAHLTDTNWARLGYFFWEKDAKSGQKPSPITDEATVAEIRKTIVESKMVIPSSPQGTRYDARILGWFLGKTVFGEGYSDFKYSDYSQRAGISGTYNRELIIKKCRSIHSNLSDCDTLGTLVHAPDWRWLVESKFSEEWSDRQIAMYKPVEEIFAKFADKLVVESDAVTTVASDTISTKSLEDSSSLMNPVQARVRQQLFGDKSGVRIPLLRYLSEVAKGVHDISRQHEERFAALRKRGIGWYTSEQEADEIAVELASGVGIEPNQVSQSFLEMLKERENALGLSYAECKKLQENHFGLRSGSVTPVLLTDWFDIHHDICYRVFNIEREIVSHKFEVKKDRIPQFSTSWSDEQKALSLLLESEPSNNGSAPAAFRRY